MLKSNSKDGCQKLINRNTGKVKIEKNYLGGKLSGRFIYYWDNGQVRLSGYYKKNKRSGKWQNFDSSGQLISEENYDLVDKLELINQ